MIRFIRTICATMLVALPAIAAPNDSDPIHIEGIELSKLSSALPDGGLPPAVGVRNIQVFRASRDVPEMTDRKGWTYNHHMDMACWKGRLYVAWTNGEKDEDTWPSREVYSTSEDGVNWESPRELFPQGISTSLRMYFFHAPNGLMLVIAGLRVSHEKLDEATKTGLVVREINADHTLGDVFTLIPNAAASPAPLSFRDCGDKGFIQACEQLLANRPFLETQDYGVLLADRRMKWHDPESSPRRLRGFGKAFSFFHRTDGALVGICKRGWTTISTDGGDSWSLPVRPASLITNNAKVWGTRTPDGRYALVYNPKEEDRFPLAMVSGDDGIAFKDMRIVHGEVPRQRYQGESKNIGAQYVRGISEWATDGSRKDDALWVVYSVNKEDVWVSRIPTPAPATGWSTYSPKWAPVTMKGDDMTLEDRDPYDFARATYTFEESPRISVKFQLGKVESAPATLKLEFQSRFASETPVRFSLPNAPLTIQINLNANAGTSDMIVDGKSTGVNPLPGPIKSFQRLSFQTDDWRGVGQLDPVPPGSDKPTAAARFIIRNLEVHNN